MTSPNAEIFKRVTFFFAAESMELSEVERCCCVVSVSEASSSKGPVSFSGVLVHPNTGTVICTGLPFSRFVTGQERHSADVRLLRPPNLSKKLQIRVSFSSQRHLRANQCAQGSPVVPFAGQTYQADAELLMLVNCLEFKQAFQAVFREADQWRFHGDKEEAEDEDLLRDAQFLSWFAVLRTDVVADICSGSVLWQDASTLQKGGPVVACGSPFGSLCLDLFISTISRGIISNLAGEGNAVILTDARCLPGTEGGGLFAVRDGGGLCLAGLIVSPFGWRANEWIGLTLVCSVRMIFGSIVSCTSAQDPLREVWPCSRESDVRISNTAQEGNAARYPLVCFVDSGHYWGSGVVVAPDLVLTCRHVVNGKSTVNLKFHHKERVQDMTGDVLFSTKASSPYDVALVQLRRSLPEAVVPQMAQRFSPGESVLVVGYGGLGRRCGPSLTCGILSKAIGPNQRPIMLQTTCAVQSGASGGAVVRTCSGELLGIVSSNTRDLAAKVTYPHLNFSIPVTVLQELLHQFNLTGDVDVFKVLDTTEEEVKRVWRLQDTPSKL